MSVLAELVSGIGSGAIEVVDLTAPLTERVPVIQLPPPFANTPGFALEEISRYDERGPAWYWNTIHTGEHVGTHFDAPIHWVSGKDKLDVSQVPVRPVASCARSSTRTRVRPGVVASHDGMIAVAPKPGVAHGDVQVPAS